MNKNFLFFIIKTMIICKHCETIFTKHTVVEDIYLDPCPICKEMGLDEYYDIENPLFIIEDHEKLKVQIKRREKTLGYLIEKK
jgi:hypothetical protein